MRQLLFILTALFGFTVSCEQQNDQDKNVITEKKQDSTQTLAQMGATSTIPQTTFQFDTLVFKKGIDSLIKSIYSSHVKTTLQADTIKKQGEFKIYPFIDSAQWTIKYRFRPKPAGGLSVTVYESQLADTSTADRLLKITKAFGQQDSPYPREHQNRAPAGLSYAYDFVFRHKDKIFALNTPCTYSDKNYYKLLYSFKKSFKATIPSDTIACHCGGFCK